MATEEQIRTAFDVGINLTLVKDYSREDVKEIIKTHSLIQDSLDAFLKQKITFNQYCEVCAACNVHMDNYLKNCETNLETMRIL